MTAHNLVVIVIQKLEGSFPQFKQRNYGQGLIAAVSSLAELAAAGPRSKPPTPALTDRILDSPILKFGRQNNPIAQKGGPLVITLMVIAGLGCVFASIFLPQYRKPLLIGGLVLLGLALLFWIVVLLVFAFGRWSGGSGGGFSGGGFSGGGFSGGSSGGGGASGSW